MKITDTVVLCGKIQTTFSDARQDTSGRVY